MIDPPSLQGANQFTKETTAASVGRICADRRRGGFAVLPQAERRGGSRRRAEPGGGADFYRIGNNRPWRRNSAFDDAGPAGRKNRRRTRPARQRGRHHWPVEESGRVN